MQTAITNCKIFTGDAVIDDGVIITEQGIIIAVEKEAPAAAKHIDLKGKNIAAGFFDIQINGGEKFYFSQHPTTEALHDICRSSLKYGTTHVLPCLISSSHQHILQAITTVKHFMHTHDEGVLGLHLEGPFINPEKRGAHVKSLIRKPTNKELKEIIRHGSGTIKIMTIAPECFTDDQIRMLVDSGIILSAGHTNMSYSQAQYYFGKGISMVTHLYNAMTQMQHRSPGVVGATLNNNNVYAPVILDGAHCDYAAAEIAYKIKGDKLFLISDAAFLGRKIQSIAWGEFKANLIDGFYRNDEGNLAGAAISMAEAVQNAVKHLHIPLDKAINMANLHPAKAMRLDDRIGRIEKGYPAKFIVFNDGLAHYETLII